MKSTKYLPALRQFNSLRKSGTPGERVLGSLFPARSMWSCDYRENPYEQVNHMVDTVYVAVNTICSRMAGIFPNLCYVSDGEQQSSKHTVKAMWRGLMNACHKGFAVGGYDGSVSSGYGKHSLQNLYSNMSFSDGGHSFLTMGELRSKALSVVKPHEELEPLDGQHPLRKLLENPNPYDTTFDLMYETQMFQELTGVSYIWLVPNEYGGVAEMWCMPSHWVWPVCGGKGAGTNYGDPDKLIKYYEIRPWGGMGSAGCLRIPPEDMVMERWKSPVNKIAGYSKLAAGARWIDSEEAISNSRWSQFENQARPELWVKTPAGAEDPDDDAIARIESKIMNKIQGAFNFAKPIVTSPGVELVPLSFNPTEMSYYQCLDEQTECLTADGWKKYTELTTETSIACYDANLNSIVYQRPSKVYVSDYDGPMHHWKELRVDVLATPDHRMYVQNCGRAGPLWGVELMKDMDKIAVYRFKSLSSDNQTVSNELSCGSHRSVVQYKGKIWCVSVPTTFFVVRRNGKVHVTGNSFEQMRDAVFTLFQISKAAVGLNDQMTYGSILAVLASVCSNCINPRLAMRGQSLTKQLGKRYDDKRPAWSTLSSGGYGASAQNTTRRIKLWWDDTVPADPAQVNSDLQLDMQAYAVTPDEVRALRGRKPYAFFGDCPLVQGPGGIMPLPTNGDDLGDLAGLIQPFTKPGQEEAATLEGAEQGIDRRGDEVKPGVGEMTTDADAGQEDAGIAEPNGEPKKRLMSVQLKDYEPGTEVRYTGRDQCRQGTVGTVAELIFDARGGRWRVRVRWSNGEESEELPTMLSKSLQPDVELQAIDPVAAGVALVADDTGRVLMLQRPLEGDHNDGKWEMPGGKIDDGEETPRDSAIREWCEEVGLENFPPARSDGEWTSVNGKYQGFVYRVPTEDSVDFSDRAPDVDGGAVAALAWVDPRDLPTHNLRPALLADVDEVLSAIVKSLRRVVKKSRATKLRPRYVTADDVRKDADDSVATEWRALYERFQEFDYADIERRVKDMLSPLTVARLKTVAQKCGITLTVASKSGIVDLFVRRITERKGSYDRNQFRAGDFYEECKRAALDALAEECGG